MLEELAHGGFDKGVAGFGQLDADGAARCRWRSSFYQPGLFGTVNALGDGTGGDGCPAGDLAGGELAGRAGTPDHAEQIECGRVGVQPGHGALPVMPRG